MTQEIKYIAINVANDEPLFESNSYEFLLNFVRKIAGKYSNEGEIKIYKRVTTVEETEMTED